MQLLLGILITFGRPIVFLLISGGSWRFISLIRRPQIDFLPLSVVVSLVSEVGSSLGSLVWVHGDETAVERVVVVLFGQTARKVHYVFGHPNSLQ